MQFADDVALATAIQRPDRRLASKLEIDWGHDGQYDHAYSDFSRLLLSAKRDGAIDSDLPERVNVVIGASSGDVRIRIGGRKRWDEYTAVQLLSPNRFDSPLYGTKVEGTKIRYSRVIYTSEGRKVVRQFTGKIREYYPSVQTGEVELVCQDNLDLNGSPVTFPLWGVGTVSPYFQFWYTDPAVGRPFSTTWLIEEALRQCDYHTGPKPRDGCVSYQTCNGSLLPSFGYGHLAEGTNVDKYPHSLTYSNNNPWEEGLYGLAPRRITDTTTNKAFFNSQSYVYVPQNGTSNGPVNLVWSAWVKFIPSAGASNRYVQSHFWLDDAPAIDGGGSGSYGRATALVYEDGDFRMQVQEGWLADQFGYRTWQWQWDLPAITDGWHYVSFAYKFRNNLIAYELKIDGVAQGTAHVVNSPGAFGFRHGTFGTKYSNPISFTTQIPVQHVQWSSKTLADFPVYVAGEELPPLNDDGLPFAIVNQTRSEIAWIPDTVDKDGWDLLKEIVSAEFGAIYINEYGQVVTIPHAQIRNVTEVMYQDAPTVNDDQLMDFPVNPSVDQYRNAISISWTFRYSQEDIVWRNKSAKDYYLPVGGNIPIDDYPVEDVIAIRSGVNYLSFEDNDEKAIPLWQTSIASCQYANPDLESLGGYVVTLQVRNSQRTFGLGFGAGSMNPACYIGAFKGANQPAMLVAGRRYSDSQTIRKIIRNEAAITANGGKVRMITIGDSPWRQTESTIDAIAGEDLMGDLITPVPAVNEVAIVGDPRIQYLDVLAIENRHSVTGKVFAQVLGRGFDDTDSKFDDRLTLRLIRQPNNWILGDNELSDLGNTTIL